MCELIGGIEPARGWCSTRSRNGKHVVTANKALLAQHGTEIFAAAHAQGRDGRVRGGGRRRRADHQGAARGPDRQPHRVDRRHHQRHVATSSCRRCATRARRSTTVLTEAQALRLRRGRPDVRRRGHRRRAQAHDPVGDRLRHPDAVRQGVHRGHLEAARARTSATPRSSATASSCSASRGARRSGIELRVHPTLIPARRLIANVEGVMNAVLVKGDAVGADALLRRRRGRRADRERGDRRPRRRHAHAHRRSRAPRAASRVPARPALRRADPADGRGRDQLLPAHARRRTGPACSPTSRASSPTARSRSTR